MLKTFRQISSNSAPPNWNQRWSDTGIEISHKKQRGSTPLQAPLIAEFMTQFLDDGYAHLSGDGYVIGWDSLYQALASSNYSELASMLALPSFTDRRPVLESSGSLTDAGFSISMAGWADAHGRAESTSATGAVLQATTPEMMRPEHWALLQEVRTFAQREQRDETYNRLAWGRMRTLAVAADARLDNFLHSTVVLTPDRLEIGLRRSDVADANRVVEVIPGFAKAPAEWITRFDRNREVQDIYHLSTPEGVVQVVISPQVRAVLQEIKRMPGRRVAGTRAEAFILNPYATLGIEAGSVIEEVQFEEAREAAGLDYERFAPVFERTSDGYPLKVGLLIESANASGLQLSETRWLDDGELQEFIDTATAALARNRQLLGWGGYEFEVQGDTPRFIEDLKQAWERRQLPPVLVTYVEVHDLPRYSDRIRGIGEEKPVYSPYFEKKNKDDGWFPDNVTTGIVAQLPGGESIYVPTNTNTVAGIKAALAFAAQSGGTSIQIPGVPGDVPIATAENIVAALGAPPLIPPDYAPVTGPSEPQTTNKPRPTNRLILIENINALAYEQRRSAALLNRPAEPQLPRGIRAGVALKDHQREGLAWMQHLYDLQESFQVRGAILADDMGLGKTFQLLALMAWLIDRQPTIEPILVIAPVSLLENWAEEAEKFFVAGALPILTAYGHSLESLRVPRAQIDEKLKTEDGLVKFLRPGWIGDAKVVLTTYETLRDFEFSFAAQKWSLMVCDEAQKIKNPAAMVTRAAKKQNADFKIACTGTPVENTLADIWCLFDFIQPGLLGALNDFGLRYRKPIEAKTDAQNARVEELRYKIAPQILRRLKADVAKDLPKKIVSEECRNLPISDTQRNFYAQAIASFRQPDHGGNTAFKNPLGLLHYLRLICTDPKPHGLNVFHAENTTDYRTKAPKLDWLLRQLQSIRSQGEKAIIFCEFREIQRLLAHYIDAELGFKADIINGDTAASASQADSRQKRLKKFQELPGFGAIILSPAAVGFGVNIQAANHVIHYTRTWNPAKEDQATDRAYRIGQTKDVHVYYPTVRAHDFTTFDVKLDRLLEHKRELAKDMLNGTGEMSGGEFGPIDGPGGGQPLGSERITIGHTFQLDGRGFEALLAVLYLKQGYRTHLTPSSNDKGVDVLAFENGEKQGCMIQAKCSSIKGEQLGHQAIQEIVSGVAHYQKSFPITQFAKICFTNQYFNDNAEHLARLNNVTLLDQGDLTKLLNTHSVTMWEVESARSVTWLYP